MDLKNTKATRPKPIAAPSKNLNQPSTTEKHSAALKNTCSVAQRSTYKFHQQGQDAEAFVQSYFLCRGWIISSTRTKYEGVEVDLIVEKASRRVLLEVKYLNQSWRAFERVGTKQIQRLKYVLLGMRRQAASSGERLLKIEGYVVFVLPDGKLHFISLDEVI